jgi:organic hydroperoxide reductase OsmC/OhrA
VRTGRRGARRPLIEFGLCRLGRSWCTGGRPIGPGYALATTLRVELPERLKGDAGTALLEAAHHTCPYSNATRGNMPVEIVTE